MKKEFPVKVLIAPLDWGLGHAARCEPIIWAFRAAGAEVSVGVSGQNSEFFKKACPDVKQFELPSYRIVYPKIGAFMPLWLLSKSSEMHQIIQEEHKQIEALVQKEDFQIVLSDNRFGAWSSRAFSIYMTHQLRISFPKMFRHAELLGEKFHAKLVSPFNEIWVPDTQEAFGLAGKLSHAHWKKHNLRYVGALSRFATLEENFLPKSLENSSSKIDLQNFNHFDFLGVVSGVEPARSRLENKLFEIFSHIDGHHAILQGLPNEEETPLEKGNVTFFPHLPTEKFRALVRRSKYFVSRSGYSTVMDQCFLGSNCLFIPTPGQTEQEYLAKMLQRKGFARRIKEHNLSAKSLVNAFRGEPRKLPRGDSSKLYQAVREALENSQNFRDNG